MPSSMTGATGMRPTGQQLKGYDTAQLPTWTPEQQQLFSELMPLLQKGGFLQQLAGGDEGMFRQMEEPAMRQFAGLQGNLASRFSGAGTGGRHSSGFQNTMSQASSDFASDLQSQRMNLQQQAVKDLLGLGSQLLGQHGFENVVTQQPQKKRGFWEELVSGAAPAAGFGITKLLSGGLF